MNFAVFIQFCVTVPADIQLSTNSWRKGDPKTVTFFEKSTLMKTKSPVKATVANVDEMFVTNGILESNVIVERNDELEVSIKGVLSATSMPVYIAPIDRSIRAGDANAIVDTTGNLLSSTKYLNTTFEDMYSGK